MNYKKNVIEIRELCKSYGSIKAVNQLSFDVREGELFAFLGVNGAGKSTTINILCGQMQKDSGEVLIDGLGYEQNAEQIKRTLGVVFQGSVLDQTLSVYDNLKSRGALYGIHGKEFEDRLAELSCMLHFKDILKRPVGKLSGGQRRRIDIARALLHRPGILILDEPTTGLDPQTRRLLWNVIADLRRKEGLTVLLTTHYMEEAADADYVVIIDSGRIAAEGTPLELKNKYTGDFLTIYGINETEADLLGFGYEKLQGAFRFLLPDTGAATDLILKMPELFKDYEITKGKMDDVFLAVTGKTLMEGEEK